MHLRLVDSDSVKQPQDQAGRAIHEDHKRARQSDEHQHRRGHAERELLRTAQRQRFRHQLTHNDLKVGDAGKSDGCAGRMGEERGMGQRRQRPLDQRGHHRLAQPAERQACHRHPELHRRERVIQRAAQLGHSTRAGPRLRQQLLHPGGAQAHQRKLCSYKEAVRQDESDDGNNVEERPVNHVDRVKQRFTAASPTRCRL